MVRERRWMSPSATPATQNEGRCLQVRRLPRETKVDVTKRLAWHAKWKSMSPSATPATQSGGPWSPSATPATQKCTVHVAKGHACHANSGGVYGVNWEPSAPPEPAQCHKCHACHAKWRSMVAKCHACHAK